MTIYRETLKENLGLRGEFSASDISEFTEILFERTCKAVRERQQMSPQERTLFEQHANEFAESLRVILADSDVDSRRAALRAAISALSIGYYHAGSPRLLNEMRRKFDSERAKHARDARQVPPVIQEIINRRARAFWASDPSFRDNKNGTAKKIYGDIVAARSQGNAAR